MESFLDSVFEIGWLLVGVGVVVVVGCLYRVATSESPEDYRITLVVVGVMGVFVMLIFPLYDPDPYGCRIDPGICIGNYPSVDLHCYR